MTSRAEFRKYQSAAHKQEINIHVGTYSDVPLMLREYYKNKNAFQWDAYCRLVDWIPACTAQGCLSRGVSARGCLLGEGVSAQEGVSAKGVL